MNSFVFNYLKFQLLNLFFLLMVLKYYLQQRFEQTPVTPELDLEAYLSLVAADQ